MWSKYTKPLLVTVLVIIVGVAGFLAFRPNFSKVKADNQQYVASFTASLTAEQEMTASTSQAQASTTEVSTAGSGTGIFSVTADNQLINYEVTAQNLSSAVTAAHLHCAPLGQSGQIIVPLMNTSSSSPQENQGTNSVTFSGSILASDILPAAISCNPNIKTTAQLVQAMREGEIYVNVHTVNFPMGEIRGQLLLSDQVIDFNATNTATTTLSTPTGTTTNQTSTSTSSTTTVTSTTNNSNNNSNSTNTTTIQTSPSGWYYVFVQPDSYYKIQGDTITFTGRHFVPGESVTVSLPHTTVTTVTADSVGNFKTGPITIPYNIGERVFTFSGNQSQIAFPVSINVGSGAPWIVLSTYYAGAGTPVTISGYQFGGNETVQVMFNGTTIGSAQTDAQGNFSLNTSVPNTGQGQWTVTATGATTNLTASQPFSQAF
jgi:hypothetical protein